MISVERLAKAGGARQNRELAYADCVRSRRSHAVYRVPRSNRD
ncbi:UNVERIFIED_ORG: hypothetical protein QOE_0087 [Clostridioides difficile F501]